MRTSLTCLIIFIIYFSTIPSKTCAQSNKISPDTTANICIMHDTIVQQFVKKNAQFRGGDLNKFRNHVMSNIRYPVQSMEKNEQGQTYIRFIVDWDGRVKDVSVLKSSGYRTLDNEAVRVVCLSPLWISAKNDSICVPQSLIIPISFRTVGIINKVPE